MEKTKLILFAVGLTVVGLNSPSCATSPIIMQYKDHSGKTYKYNINYEYNAEANFSGQVNVGRQIATGIVEYKATNKTSEKIIHELSFTELDIVDDPVLPTGKMDSKPLLNNPLLLETDLNGRNLNLVNLKDLPSSIPDYHSPAASEFRIWTIIQQLAEVPVDTNDSWSSTVRIEFDLTGNSGFDEITTNYTFVGIESVHGYKCMKISGKGIGTTRRSLDLPEFVLEADNKIESEITAFFAIDEGLFVKVKLIEKGTSDLNIPAYRAKGKAKYTQEISMSMIK